MKEAMFCSNLLTELGFGKEFEQVPLLIENTATLHVIGNRAFSSRQSTLLYVSSTFGSWWRRTKLLHITYRRSVNSLASERRIWTSIVFNNFYRWSRASNFIDVIVGVLCFSVSVWSSFSVSQVKICFVCIRFQKSRFSFASSLIERVIKGILSTLMYVCVKRIICLNLCGWQIYWILFLLT